MADEKWGRRGFLVRLGAFGAAGAALITGSTARQEAAPLVLSFGVAGSRFHMPRDYRPREGSRVVVAAAVFQGELCYEVRSTQGVRLGYVPADLVPIFARARTIRARWAQFDPGALRTDRYRVSAELVIA